MTVGFDTMVRKWAFQSIHHRLPLNCDRKNFEILEKMFEDTKGTLTNMDQEIKMPIGKRQGAIESPIDWILRIFLQKEKEKGIKFLKLKYLINQQATTRTMQGKTVGEQFMEMILYKGHLSLMFQDQKSLEMGNKLLYEIFTRYNLILNLAKRNCNDDTNTEGGGELSRNSNRNKRQSNRECGGFHPTRVKNISRLNDINKSCNNSKDRLGNEKVFKQRTEISKQTHTYQTENHIPKLYCKICFTLFSRRHVSPSNAATKIGIGIHSSPTSNAKKGFRKDSEHFQIQNHEHSNSSYNRNGKYYECGTKTTNEVYEPPDKETKRSLSKATDLQR